MAELYNALTSIERSNTVDKNDITNQIRRSIEDSGYTIVEEDISKPWGAYFKFDGEQADRFAGEFFPGLSPQEARLGNPAAELSPKILLVEENQRLSWQYHNRRAERWVFLTDGGYFKSMNDDQGELRDAKNGDVVQFEKGERHRLVGAVGQWALVAEIWQHTNPETPSNESDIVRLSDDYNR